jgi:hypothetical protein
VVHDRINRALSTVDLGPDMSPIRHSTLANVPGLQVICEMAGGRMRPTIYALILWLSLANSVMIVRASAQHLTAVSGPVSPASVDPNKAPSEFNHHIAGWA